MPFKIRGWAFVPTQPDEHVRIEVRLDGTLLTQTVANAPFADLQKLKVGAGDHGFMVNVNQEIPLAEPHRLEVLAIGAQGQRLVLEKPPSRPAPPASAPTTPAPEPAPAPTPAPAAPAPTPQTPQRRAGRPPVMSHADPNAHPVLPGATDGAQRPVFILGSARSGTTAMARALRCTDRYEGYNEGHLLNLFGKLHSVIENHYAKSARDAAPGVRTLIAHVPQSLTAAALRGALITLIRATYPTGHWFDKTPGADMIRTVPVLHASFPAARYLFMKRRPIDNIESRRRKFPAIGFKDHCRLWAESMLAWHAVRDGLGAAAIELDQLRLAHAPDQVASEIATLLDLTPPQRDRLLASLQTDLPQRTSAAYDAPQTLDTVGWTDQQQATFRATCAHPAALFGYEV